MCDDPAEPGRGQPQGRWERGGIWHRFGVGDFGAAREAIVLERGEGWGRERSSGSHLGAALEAQVEGWGGQDVREMVRRPRSGAGPQESVQRPSFAQAHADLGVAAS